MPIYTYQVIHPDGTEGDVFEVEQSMKSPLLQTHPLTDQPIRRVYFPPHLGGRHSEYGAKRRLSPETFEKAGFTRYVRDKLTGQYHKTHGTAGPDHIRPIPHTKAL